MSISKKCIVCGEQFTTKNDKGIYCSPSCRVKAHRRREKEGKTELEKNISENYAEELLHFRTNLNIIFDDVRQLKKDMLTVGKYMNSFAEKLVGIPQVKDIYKIEDSISTLSRKLESKIDKIQLRNEKKMEKNDDNIRLVSFEINNIVHEINKSKPLSSAGSTIDKILSNENLVGFVQGFIDKRNKKSEKAETSEAE